MATKNIHPSLARLYQETGLKKPSELALKLNIGASTVTNWASRGVSKDGALMASEIFGVNANYILTGNFVEPTVHASQINSGNFHNSHISQNVNTPFINYEFPQQAVTPIRLYENANIDNIGRYPVAKNLIERMGKPTSLFAVTVVGREMQPLLMDKAMVIADESKAEIGIVDGQIYALQIGESIRCRYLGIVWGGRVRVHSEQNKDGEILDQADFDKHFKVLGGVIWQSSFFNW